MSETTKTPVKHHAVTKSSRYHEGVGRRKTAVATVRIWKGDKGALINGQAVNDFFPVARIQEKVLAPLKLFKADDSYKVEARVLGGGVSAQAEAVRHGLSRALLLADEATGKLLRSKGFLTRDPRMVERKKYGLKKARRSPQWSKR